MPATPIPQLTPIPEFPARAKPQERFDAQVKAALNATASAVDELNETFIPAYNAGIDALNTLVPRAADMQALAPQAGNLAALGPRASDLAALGPKAGDVHAVAGELAAVTACATDLASINAAPAQASAAAASASAAGRSENAAAQSEASAEASKNAAAASQSAAALSEASAAQSKAAAASSADAAAQSEVATEASKNAAAASQSAATQSEANAAQSAQDAAQSALRAEEIAVGNLPDATTTTRGLVTYGATAGTACEGDDPRLTDARLATKLQTARMISLTGDVTGAASFDGSADIEMRVKGSGLDVGSIYLKPTTVPLNSDELYANGGNIVKAQYPELYTMYRDAFIGATLPPADSFALPRIDGIDTNRYSDWIKTTSGLSACFSVVVNSANGDVWAASKYRFGVSCLRSDSSGWEAAPSLGADQHRSLCVDSKNGKVWIVTDEHSTSTSTLNVLINGVWQVSYGPVPTSGGINFAFIDQRNGDVWISTGKHNDAVNNKLYVNRRGTSSWVEFLSGKYVSVMCINPTNGDIWICSDTPARGVYVLRGGTGAWQSVVTIGGSIPAYLAINTKTGDVWGAVYVGAIYVLRGGVGTTWESTNSPTALWNSLDIDPINGDVYAGMYNVSNSLKIYGYIVKRGGYGEWIAYAAPSGDTSEYGPFAFNTDTGAIYAGMRYDVCVACPRSIAYTIKAK